MTECIVLIYRTQFVIQENRSDMFNSICFSASNFQRVAPIFDLLPDNIFAVIFLMLFSFILR